MTSRLIGWTCAVIAGLTLGWVSLAGSVLSPAAISEAAVSPSSPSNPTPIQGGFGTIKGRLVWGGTQIPTPAILVKKGDASVKDAEVCASTDLLSRELIVDPASKGIRYAFAFLRSPSGKNPEAEKALLAQEVVVDQKNCEFLPYATLVFAGQQVIFRSSDPIGHNLRYSGFRNPAKNVVMAPNSEFTEKLLPERLPLELRCDIHPWMKGWVLPLDHPFFAMTKEDGSFEISGVPAGKQSLVVWQEKVGYANPEGSRGTTVMVQAGQTTDVGVITLDPGKVKN